MFLRDFSRTGATPILAAPAAPAVLEPRLRGLTAGTMLDTSAGWRPVESLHIGDRVQSLDGGAARVVALDRQTLAGGASLVHLPGGALDNCTALTLLPEQPVLVDTFDSMEAPFALMPASALVGFRGAEMRVFRRSVEVVMPIFAEEEVIWAQSGLLLHCAGTREEASFFPRLDMLEAKALLAWRASVAA